MRTALLILGIWLLLNVMFVLLVMPSRKRRRPDAKISYASSRRDAGGRTESRFVEEKTISLRHIIIAAGVGAFFVLSPPIAHAIDSIKRVFTKTPPAS
jgi:uncharacterized membrane protein